jgi:hypothetical protein
MVIAGDGDPLDAERSTWRTRIDRLAAAGWQAAVGLAPPGATVLAGVQAVTLDQPDQAGHLIARATTATTLTRHR